MPTQRERPSLGHRVTGAVASVTNKTCITPAFTGLASAKPGLRSSSAHRLTTLRLLPVALQTVRSQRWMEVNERRSHSPANLFVRAYHVSAVLSCPATALMITRCHYTKRSIRAATARSILWLIGRPNTTEARPGQHSRRIKKLKITFG